MGKNCNFFITYPIGTQFGTLLATDHPSQTILTLFFCDVGRPHRGDLKILNFLGQIWPFAYFGPPMERQIMEAVDIISKF